MSRYESQCNHSLTLRLEIRVDWSRNMDKPLPYINAALLCQQVLQEKDESLTLVRIADRLQYRIEGLPPELKPSVGISGIISLKSGPVIGEHTIKIISEKPDGNRKEVYSSPPVKFLGKDQGQNIIMNMNLGIDQDGLYWFDVLFDDELLTRMPLMVTPLGAQAPQEPKI